VSSIFCITKIHKENSILQNLQVLINKHLTDKIQVKHHLMQVAIKISLDNYMLTMLH